jgi:hypothetical protein
MTLRFLALALSVGVLVAAQDQSRAIQAEQQREVNQRGEEQRRELVRAEQRREAQAREEQELLIRRRAEAAQVEQQRAAQQADAQAPAPAREPDPPAVTPSAADSSHAEPLSSWNLAYQVAGVAVMAGSAISLMGLLLSYGIRRWHQSQ